MTKRDLAAGVDTSTQSCTMMLRNLADGSIVAEARAPHPPTTPPRSEQSPPEWIAAFKSVCHTLANYLPRIACISVGGQGHGLVLLDENDVPLRPAKLWNDTESAPDAARLETLFPKNEWEKRIGSLPGPALTISKLAWTERNHPGMVARAARIMLPFDYLVYTLSGQAVTERGGSSGTGYFSPFDNLWDFEILRRMLPSVDCSQKLPKIIDSGAVSGTVRSIEGLEPLAGAVVGAGTGDNMTAALGLNARERDTVMSLGTSGTIYGIAARGITDTRDGAINGYADATGRFMPMVTTLNAAKVTDAFRRFLGVDVNRFDEMVLGCPEGSSGLTLLPYLDGERTPNLPFATGGLYGLRTTTTAAEIARAAVEGVVCGLLEGRDALAAAGVPFGGRFLLTGGAARSRSYRQILADLSGEEIWICPITETAAAGACVQGAAAFLNVSVAEMAERWAVPPERVAVPQGRDSAAIRKRYEELSERYGRDYNAAHRYA